MLHPHPNVVSPQPDMTVGQIRQNLENLTEVQPKRQKLIGLGKKPNPPDDAPLESLQLKNPQTFMMVHPAPSMPLGPFPPVLLLSLLIGLSDAPSLSVSAFSLHLYRH